MRQRMLQRLWQLRCFQSPGQSSQGPELSAVAERPGS